MIKKRYFEIISLVAVSEKEITIKEIADLYGITERSIRYDIDELNKYFFRKGNNEIIEISNNKIKLLYTEERINEIIRNTDVFEYFLSEEERIKIMAYEIFLFKNKFILQYFVNKYNLSKTTIRYTLKELNQIIKEYNLAIETDNNRGYKIVGGEINIRKYMINILREYFKNEKDRTVKYNPFSRIVQKFLSETEMEYFKTVINKLLYKTRKTISDEAFETLQLFLVISKIRNEKKFKIEENAENTVFLSKTEEFREIEKTLKIINNIEERDIYYFVDFFLGSYSYNMEYSYFLNWVLMESLIEQFIALLSKRLNINLTKDTILRKELINHLKPAIYRMKNKLKLTESILKEVKKSYLELYDSTQISLQLISDFIGIPFDEDEIAFITVMIQRAIMRNSTKLTIKKEPNILIVCGLGYSSSRFLYENIKNRFQVNIVDIIPFNQLENYNYLRKADIIISTLDFNLEGIDVINVNPVMSENDILKLKRYGLEERKSTIRLSKLLKTIKNAVGKEIFDEGRLKERLLKDFDGYILNDMEEKGNKEKSFLEMIPKTAIILDKEVENIDEFIEFIGKVMVDSKLVNEEYIKELKEQITQYGKYIMIGEKTILPHGQLLKNVRKTGFSLVTLKKGVNFLGSEVRIGICLASRNKDEHLNAILELNEYMKNPDFENKLLSKKTPKEVIDYIESLET